MLVLCALFVLFLVESSDSLLNPENTIFKPQNSIRPPFGSAIPYWETGGTAVIGDKKISLTTSPRQNAWIRSLRRLKGNEWEMRLSFVMGSTHSVGGDGIALWITKEKVSTDGPFFGMKGKWEGVLIAFDTMFHDGSPRDHPKIYGLVNDGSVVHTKFPDWKKAQGYCNAKIRQVGVKQELFVALIIYKNGKLLVSYDPPHDSDIGAVDCFSFEIPLNNPNGYYLTLSSSTGTTLPDIHEIHSLMTWIEVLPEQENLENKKKPREDNKEIEKEVIQEEIPEIIVSTVVTKDNDNGQAPQNTKQEPQILEEQISTEKKSSDSESIKTSSKEGNGKDKEDKKEDKEEKEETEEDEDGEDEEESITQRRKRTKQIVKGKRSASKTKQKAQNDDDEPDEDDEDEGDEGDEEDEEEEKPKRKKVLKRKSKKATKRKNEEDDDEDEEDDQEDEEEEEDSKRKYRIKKKQKKSIPKKSKKLKYARDEDEDEGEDEDEDDDEDEDEDEDEEEEEDYKLIKKKITKKKKKGDDKKENPRAITETPQEQQPPSNLNQKVVEQQIETTTDNQPPVEQNDIQNEPQPIKQNFILNEEDHADIIEQLNRVLRQHITTSYSVEQRFNGMENRLDRYVQNLDKSFKGIQDNLNSFTGTDGLGETFNDMKSTLTSINSIFNLIGSVESKLWKINQATNLLHQQQEHTSKEMGQLISKGWGWWAYLLLLQLVLAVIYIIHKKRQEEKKLKVWD